MVSNIIVTSADVIRHAHRDTHREMYTQRHITETQRDIHIDTHTNVHVCTHSLNTYCTQKSQFLC